MSREQLRAEYEYWRQQAGTWDEGEGLIPGAVRNKSELEAWIKAVCKAFSVSPAEDREGIRDMISDFNILWILSGEPLILCEQVKGPEDDQPVMLGLSALLIVDGRVEEREIDHSMRQLLRVSLRVDLPFVRCLEKARDLAVSPETRAWLDKWIVATKQWQTKAVR